jgi:hypothetical protein
MPLAAEIDKNAAFSCRRKSHITSERYTVDPKRAVNARKKPRSLYRLVTVVTPRPISDAPSGQNRHSAIIDNQNIGITIEWCVL